nr:hypothetical protein [uncultured Kingella sp.]
MLETLVVLGLMAVGESVGQPESHVVQQKNRLAQYCKQFFRLPRLSQRQPETTNPVFRLPY